VDADEATAFLRQMTDELIGTVEQLHEAQRNDAAIRAVAQVQGAGLALSVATGMPREAAQEAALAAAEALADLGYLDRGEANWMGALSGPRLLALLALPEQGRQVQASEALVPVPRLVRVVPLNVEVGPDHAGAMMVLTSLELYEDRVIVRFSRLGGDPSQDDPIRWGGSSWRAEYDTGLELSYEGGGSTGALPFETGTMTWLPAPPAEARYLLMTVPTASGPEPVMLPLRD
jgi:hypothetical protein